MCKRKIKFLLSLVFVCLLVSLFTTCQAESVTIQVEDWQELKTEYKALKSRQREREKLIEELRTESVGLKESNERASGELEALKARQIDLTKSLERTAKALIVSEESLSELKKQIAKDKQSNERRLRAWKIVAIIAGAYALIK